MTRTRHGVLAAGPLPPSNAAWLMEIRGWIVFGLVVVSLDRRDADGRTWFERVLGVRPVITTLGQRAYQIVAWIAAMNVLNAVFMTLPLVIARILFFPDNRWVPNP